VCDVFTDAEITDLLGKPATVKRAVVGPETCLWGLMGFMFNVSRTTDDEPEVIKAVVDARATNPRGDVVTPEPGIGDQAVSIQGQYGRSAQIVFRAGKSAWVLNLEKVDQKLDVAAALPKLRALAKKAAAVK
jgi:hypothetical protein